MSAQEASYRGGGAIAHDKRNNFGRRPCPDAPGLKVCVFRDYDETIAGSEHPNRFVWFCIQANISDMQRSRVNVPDHLGQALRNILVKEELHAPSRTRFSSEAAAHS